MMYIYTYISISISMYMYITSFEILLQAIHLCTWPWQTSNVQLLIVNCWVKWVWLGESMFDGSLLCLSLFVWDDSGESIHVCLGYTPRMVTFSLWTGCVKTMNSGRVRSFFRYTVFSVWNPCPIRQNHISKTNKSKNKNNQGTNSPFVVDVL